MNDPRATMSTAPTTRRTPPPPPPVSSGGRRDDDRAAIRELTTALREFVTELRALGETMRQTLAQPAQSNAETRDRTAAGLRMERRPQGDFEGTGYVETTAGRLQSFGFGPTRQEEL